MSEENIKGYRHPGDVEIDRVMFITQNGNPVEITSMVETINVYQNIFRHYLECEVTVHDSSKFLHNLPYFPEQDFTGGFSGSEILVVSYKDRVIGKEKVYTHTFRLHTVSDRQSVENSEVYLFSGISEEAYHTEGVGISRAFGGSNGSTTENMIKSVFKQYFKTQSIQDVYDSLKQITHNRVRKNLNTSETIGIHKFIIPSLGVDDAIRFLCRESDCKSRIPYFVFYEDSENFNFYNVNELVARDPVDEYWYSMTNVNTKKETDKIQDSKSIIGYKVNRQFSLLENLDKGLYKAKTTRLDTLKKKKTDVVYDYQVYSKKFNKLQKKIIQGVAADKEPVESLMVSRVGHDIDPVFSSENPRPKRLDQIKDIRNSFRASIFNTSIEVMIPANPNLKVGQVIKMNFPVDTDDAMGVEEYDKYLTGKYLITKVRQIFTKTEMTTVLECTKDGGLS